MDYIQLNCIACGKIKKDEEMVTLKYSKTMSDGSKLLIGSCKECTMINNLSKKYSLDIDVILELIIRNAICKYKMCTPFEDKRITVLEKNIGSYNYNNIIMK